MSEGQHASSDVMEKCSQCSTFVGHDKGHAGYGDLFFCRNCWQIINPSSATASNVAASPLLPSQTGGVEVPAFPESDDEYEKWLAACVAAAKGEVAAVLAYLDAPAGPMAASYVVGAGSSSAAAESAPAHVPWTAESLGALTATELCAAHVGVGGKSTPVTTATRKTIERAVLRKQPMPADDSDADGAGNAKDTTAGAEGSAISPAATATAAAATPPVVPKPTPAQRKERVVTAADKTLLDARANVAANAAGNAAASGGAPATELPELIITSSELDGTASSTSAVDCSTKVDDTPLASGAVGTTPLAAAVAAGGDDLVGNLNLDTAAVLINTNLSLPTSLGAAGNNNENGNAVDEASHQADAENMPPPAAIPASSAASVEASNDENISNSTITMINVENTDPNTTNREVSFGPAGASDAAAGAAVGGSTNNGDSLAVCGERVPLRPVTPATARSTDGAVLSTPAPLPSAASAQAISPHQRGLNMDDISLEQCQVCLEEFTVNGMAAMECGHKFCIQCFAQTIKTKMDAGVKVISCPYVDTDSSPIKPCIQVVDDTFAQCVLSIANLHVDRSFSENNNKNQNGGSSGSVDIRTGETLAQIAIRHEKWNVMEAISSFSAAAHTVLKRSLSQLCLQMEPVAEDARTFTRSLLDVPASLTSPSPQQLFHARPTENPSATYQCGSLLLSARCFLVPTIFSLLAARSFQVSALCSLLSLLAADVRSSDDVIAFEGHLRRDRIPSADHAERECAGIVDHRVAEDRSVHGAVDRPGVQHGCYTPSFGTYCERRRALYICVANVDSGSARVC